MPDRYDADGIKYGRAFEKDPAMRQALSDTSIEDKVKITQAHKNINALAGQLEKSQRDFHKQLKSVSASITSTAKQQQKLVQQIKMKELSSSRDVKVVEKSVQQILGKMGYVVDSLGKTTKRIMVDTARSTKEHLKEYGRALSADFSIHKGNFLAMTLAKATPIFGYFVGKFMETTVFRHFADLIKTKLGMAITFVGNKMRDLLSRALGVFKKKKAPTVRTKEEYDEDLPHLQKGGYVKKSGAAHIHAAEVVTPITKMREAFKNALKPLQGAVVKELRGLRYATVGIGRDVSASFGMAIMRIPLFRGLVNTFQLMKTALNVTKFWFGRQRNKYYTFLSKNSNPQARAADNIGVFYIGAMLKYDIMISHLRSIEQHLTGKKSRAPKVETWSNDSKENNQRLSGSGFFSNIKEKFIGRKRKKTAPSWEAYERYDEFGNIIPGNYAEGATKVAGDKIPEYVKKSSVYKYFDKKYSKLEKTIKGTDTFKYIKKKYKKVRKSKSVIGIEDFIGDLQSGDFDTEERLEDLKKGTKKTYKKGKKWTKQHVTGVSGKGLAEAALWVTVIAPVKTLIGAVKIVNKSVIGIAKATMWMAKLPFRVLFKTVSIAIRSLLMIGRGISKLTHALVSLPFKLANTVVNMGTKIITGALSGISSVFRYIGKAGGVGAAIKKVASKAWYGSGKRTAGKKGASKVAATNAREKQKTGIEGELQKIRHSITEFHGSVSEDWADMKFDKKKDNKWWNVIKNAKAKGKELKKAWEKTKKSFQFYRDKVAKKEKKKEMALMTRIAEATESTSKHTKKKGGGIFSTLMNLLPALARGGVVAITGLLVGLVGAWIGKRISKWLDDHNLNIFEKFQQYVIDPIKNFVIGLRDLPRRIKRWGISLLPKWAQKMLGIEELAKDETARARWTRLQKEGAPADVIEEARLAAQAEAERQKITQKSPTKDISKVTAQTKNSLLTKADVPPLVPPGSKVTPGSPSSYTKGQLITEALRAGDAAKAQQLMKQLTGKTITDTPKEKSSIMDAYRRSYGGAYEKTKGAFKKAFVKVKEALGPSSGFGWLSRMFESAGAGAGAHGYDPAGGHSYGYYQFAQNRGVVQDFLKRFPEYGKQFAGLQIGSDAFNQKWEELGKNKAFGDAQHQFTKEKYLQPVLNTIQKATGIDLKSKSPILTEVALSSSVQYGPGSSLLPRALSGTTNKTPDPELVQRIFDYKYGTVDQYFKSSPTNIKNSVRNRIQKEGSIALDYVGKTIPKAHGGADVVDTQEGVAVLRKDERVLSPSQVIAYDRMTTEVLPKLAETIGHLTAASQMISTNNVAKSTSLGAADNRRIFNIFGNSTEDKHNKINKLFNGDL